MPQEHKKFYLEKKRVQIIPFSFKNKKPPLDNSFGGKMYLCGFINP